MPRRTTARSSSLLVRGEPKQIVESYLRFTVSGITGTVQSATLRLKSGSNGTVDGPAVYTSSGTWTETGIKWSNKPAHDATVIGDAGKIATNATVDYDVKSVVSGERDVHVRARRHFGRRRGLRFARERHVVEAPAAGHHDRAVGAGAQGEARTAPRPLHFFGLRICAS